MTQLFPNPRVAHAAACGLRLGGRFAVGNLAVGWRCWRCSQRSGVRAGRRADAAPDAAATCRPSTLRSTTQSTARGTGRCHTAAAAGRCRCRRLRSRAPPAAIPPPSCAAGRSAAGDAHGARHRWRQADRARVWSGASSTPSRTLPASSCSRRSRTRRWPRSSWRPANYVVDVAYGRAQASDTLTVKHGDNDKSHGARRGRAPAQRGDHRRCADPDQPAAFRYLHRRPDRRRPDRRRAEPRAPTTSSRSTPAPITSSRISAT